MSRTIGIAASAALTAAIAVFAASMLMGSPTLSYVSSLLLSFAYVTLVGVLAGETGADRQAAALIGVAFASMYSSMVAVVYFIQLTTVAQASAAPAVLDALSYAELGSLMFNLDLLGYGLMSISTFFVGLAMRPENGRDRLLRILLLLHGVFAPACLLMPVLNVFGSMPKGSGTSIGILILTAWCVYFAPIGILSILHFRSSTPVRR